MNSPYELLAGLALLREKKRSAQHTGDSHLHAWSALLVKIGDRNCVIAQGDIEEILTQDKLTAVRGVADWVAGVGFFQGKLLNVIDGRYLFNDVPQEHKTLLSAVRVLVIPGDKEWFGLRVDELMGIRHVWTDHTDAPPLDEHGVWTKFFDQWIKIEEQLLPVLNVKALAQALEQAGTANAA